MAEPTTPTPVDTDHGSGAPSETHAPEGNGPVAEFRIVRRNADRRGPLAPYRLAIAVLVVAVVVGPALWSSLRTGAPDDDLLLRAAGIGVLVWITTGIVSRALADAALRSDTSDPATPGPS